MTLPKPKYVPQPRALNDYQVAALFGRGEGWFRDRRAKLEAAGFPECDELLGGRDGKAIEAWFDRRSELRQAPKDDDGALDKRLEEFGNG